ncbi:hypothetical protein [Halobacterium noricense]|uniref:hypothetical protein n=1 Tax=Halobacterium noricense TaxID=223182 RepID=UPI001E5C98B3|nr:hypothetical protein [Halobacterium noricense]UHH26468.1 hypothetical protein LT974_05900 [Halobacterium noricense]
MPLTKSELREAVLDSNPDEWEFIDMPETWVLLSEELKIEEVGSPSSEGRRDITQPDFVNRPDDEHDQRTQIRVSYRGVPIDQRPALSLDGHRIMMVQPDTDHSSGDRYLTEYEAHLSQIMSQDDFLRRQGNTIDVGIQGRGV